MGDKPSFKDRLAGAMRFVSKPRKCSHCHEMDAMSSNLFCYPCHNTANRLLQRAVREGLLTRVQSRTLWRKCKGNYLATVELADLIEDRLLQLKESNDS